LLVSWEQIKRNQLHPLQCSNKLPQQVFSDGIQFCRHYPLNVNNHVKWGKFNSHCKQKNVQVTQVPHQLSPHYLWFGFHAHYTVTVIKTIKLPSSSMGKEMLIWKKSLGSRSIAPLILNLGPRWRWVISLTPWLLYHQGWSLSVHNEYEAG
jgi:hypothetical protein